MSRARIKQGIVSIQAYPGDSPCACESSQLPDTDGLGKCPKMIVPGQPAYLDVMFDNYYCEDCAFSIRYRRKKAAQRERTKREQGASA